MLWLPAPQATSRTRIPDRIAAISISVSVTSERPAENNPSHFAQPDAADSQVLRSSRFDVLSAIAHLPDRSNLARMISWSHYFGFWHFPAESAPAGEVCCRR